MSRTLDAIMPKTRQQVLSMLLLNDDKEWYLADLAKAIGTKPANIQREVATLAMSGILKQRRDGNRVYYSADASSPIFHPLRDLFDRTSGIIDTLQQYFLPVLQTNDIAFVFGSFARHDENARSDIDLMIVGDTSLFQLSTSIRAVEKKLQRVLNPITYSTDEFTQKLRSGNHFVSTVWQSPKLFVKGTEDVLARLIERESDSPAPHKQTGDR